MNFEQLWESAEEKSSKILDKENFFDLLKDLIEEYYDIEKMSIAEDYRKQLKNEKFGKILFKIAELSKNDDVNIFEALTNAIKR